MARYHVPPANAIHKKWIILYAHIGDGSYVYIDI